jgi:gluconate 2-dehydrogenase gamma chain
MHMISRRSVLSSTALGLLLAGSNAVQAGSLRGALPWRPFAALPPQPFADSNWHFFTAQEACAIEAIVDRLIPRDELGPGGKEAGCAVFIDRQLAGTYGSSERLYNQGPFLPGLPTQGYQGAANPAQRYRAGLAAIDKYAREAGGKIFAELSLQQQDKLLTDIDGGHPAVPDAAGFFNLMLQNTMEGFFADPIYGGNRGMAGWKMIGFPGARYDYRDHVGKHNQPYPLPPVSIAGRVDWKLRK